VASPLLWGVHVAANSPFKSLTDLNGSRAAISRFGSGSHLMAFILAKNEGWDSDELGFEVIQTIEGAIKGLKDGKADFFMWEHFTTKPLVDQGIFRRIADCPTPWPCFVIASTQKAFTQDTGALKHLMEVINTYTSDFKRIPSIDRTLANRYNLALEDVQMWLAETRWTQNQVETQTVDLVQDTLFNLNLISNKIPSVELLTNL
jgi:hypothetical protein